MTKTPKATTKNTKTPKVADFKALDKKEVSAEDSLKQIIQNLQASLGETTGIIKYLESQNNQLRGEITRLSQQVAK